MSGNFLPPNRLVQGIGRLVLRVMGWRIEGQLPALDRYVAIGAHHTSSWDFVLFIAAKFMLRLNLRWFGKHSLFRWPWGRLLRAWGGIAIRRDRRLNTVQQAIQAFQRNPQFILVLSPEGTRRKVERWKTGFYHIAKGAGVPVLLAALDYGHKRLVIGPVLWPGPDEAADMQAIAAFYREVTAKKPENALLVG
jgi:1-acyl-sn-glycerol-3-phosphate acyltransferase